ncbi:MAG: MFS transporter [Sphingomonadaceae bacterium]|nr:MFS transporter [Sphingomonadaceae bacterium]
MAGSEMSEDIEPSASDIRLVIAASSAGTVFEWYDFFIYGTLAGLIGQTFFPTDNETLQVLLVWAGFAVGFGFRPLGAILFGFLGDKLGRKYTFLVTVTLMGIATAGVGLIPSAATIGIAAPIIIILLRVLQGLALGGEYGGAAIYVSEHAPSDRRGYYTGYIQASVVGGFVLSVAVVLACRFLIPADAFASWGWRIPFLLSIALLGISLWMRLKLNESPVFKAMQAAGEVSANPFVESFSYPGNKKRIFIALFGITGGLTTIWYTAFFSSLAFLKGPMRMDPTTVEIMLGTAGLLSMAFFVYIGKLSDRIGRKKPIIWGYVLTLILMFPLFWAMGSLANPGLAETSRTTPVAVSGPSCTYDPFASEQPTNCGKVLQVLSDSGISYSLGKSDNLQLSVGNKAYPVSSLDWGDDVVRRAELQGWLEENGYNFETQMPPLINVLGIVALLVAFGALSGATYGSVAALLTEMFPAKIRYSSMSIPYHIGAGYLGGFLPLIAAYIVARTGDAYAGLWYTWVIVVIALIVGVWGIPSGPPKDFEEANSA